MSKFGISQPVRRIDDIRVLTGAGRYVDDIQLAGQLHGGIVQGAGQALMECAVYDDEGQLLSGSFMDYCMPRSGDFPFFDFTTLGVPTRSNPLGIKGCGEAGTVGATAAAANAVCNALAYAGAGRVDMPLTAVKIWSALTRSKAA